MDPLEPSNLTIVGSEYSNTAEAQEKDLKTAWMKMTEFFKEEISKYLIEIQKDTNKKLEEMNKSLKEVH